jgi:hypothetical protein
MMMVYKAKVEVRKQCVLCKKTYWTKRVDSRFCSNKCCSRYKYISNREKILDYNKQWAKEHPDRIAKYHKNWLKKNRKKWNKTQARYKKKVYHKNIKLSRAKGREMYYKLKGEKNV